MDILKELQDVYQLISSVPVQGDAIDIIATARTKLRLVHIELKKTKEEVSDEWQP